MKRIMIALTFALCTMLQAQTAQVIVLTPEDTAAAKAVWDRLQQAQKDWSDLKDKINHKYTTLPEQPGVACTNIEGKGSPCRFGKWFWADIEFSEDFKVIVPKPDAKASPFVRFDNAQTYGCLMPSNVIPNH